MITVRLPAEVRAAPTGANSGTVSGCGTIARVNPRPGHGAELGEVLGVPGRRCNPVAFS